jgi:hypothetical protein
VRDTVEDAQMAESSENGRRHFVPADRLADLVRELIDQSGLGLRGLHRRTGIPYQTWSAWQRRNDPRVISREALEVLLDLVKAEPERREEALSLHDRIHPPPRAGFSEGGDAGGRPPHEERIHAFGINIIRIGPSRGLGALAVLLVGLILAFVAFNPTVLGRPWNDETPPAQMCRTIGPRTVHLRLPDSTPIGQELRHGQQVTIQRRDPATGKVYVTADDGRKGWVFEKYLVSACDK